MLKMFPSLFTSAKFGPVEAYDELEQAIRNYHSSPIDLQAFIKNIREERDGELDLTNLHQLANQADRKRKNRLALTTLAANLGQAEIIKTLHKEGVSPRMKGNWKSPVLASISSRNAQARHTTLNTALQHNYSAGLKTRNAGGDSRRDPFHYIAKFEKTDPGPMIKTLKEKGVKPSTDTKKGRSPMHYAALYNNAAAVKALKENFPEEFANDNKDKAGETALEIAAARRNQEAVEALFDQFQYDDRNLIHRAFWNALNAKTGNEGCTKFLASHYIRDDEVRHNDALFLVARQGNLDLLKCMVEELGFDLNMPWIRKERDQQASNKITILDDALGYGQLEIAEYALSKGCPSGDQKHQYNVISQIMERNSREEISDEEVVPLMRYVFDKTDIAEKTDRQYILDFLGFAIRSNNLELVRLILDRFQDSIDLNTLDRDSRRTRFKHPLGYAASQGYDEMVKLLIDKGADASLINIGSTDLTATNSSSVDILLENGAGLADISMQEALERGQVASVLKLVRDGADVQESNSIIEASRLEDIELVTAICEKDVDLDVCNDEGETPVLIAIRNNDPKTLRKLLEYEADPNFTAPKGAKRDHPLLAARKVDAEENGGSKKLSELLLNKGARDPGPAFNLSLQANKRFAWATSGLGKVLRSRTKNS